MTAASRGASEPEGGVRQRLVDRTRYLFAVPSTRVAATAIGVLGAAIGIVALGATSRGIAVGIVVVAAPTWFTVVWRIYRQRRSPTVSMGPARAALLALVSSGVLGAFVLAGLAVRAVLSGGDAILVDAALVGAAGTFALRLLVLVSVAGPPLSARLWPAVVQPAATVVALRVIVYMSGRALVATPAVAATLLAALLYGGIVVSLVAFVDHGMTDRFEVSAFRFLHGFLEYVAGRSAGLEDAFESLGEQADATVGVLVAVDEDGMEKARVVVPDVHPGPLPGVAGGTLPERIATETDSDSVILAPHGYAGHAYNPATSQDVKRVCEAANRAAADADPIERGSEPVVVHEGDATVVAQRLGGVPWCVSTFAPAATDDVERRVGERVREVFDDMPILADAHNARPTDDLNDGHVLAGSDRARMLRTAASQVSAALDRAPEGRLEVGVAARDTPYSTAEGIGPLGIQAFATRVRGRTAVHVLVDGNNLRSAFREQLREAVHKAAPDADTVVVATTDTHAVNHNSAANYVGRNVDGDAFADLVAEAAHDAVADLEPAAVGAAMAETQLTVLGEGTIDELAAYTDRILPRCGAFTLVSSVIVTVVAAAVIWIAN